ncbi:AAA family ATPase [Bradyrhizobium iriomotense]|uniref:AAA family ATPase n=1 Tax=Bradyrhizobium iriomotense TaxID=441950 RepID=UPI001B8A55C0|nr:AAA family ATPase [Bradyrhizobium iriomotense]MBR1133284.1 AAA family ATPase [Bradyrhizobium iriomotense]
MGDKEIAAAATMPAVRRMGPLELVTYKAGWKAARGYRRHVDEIAMRRKLEAAAREAQDQIMKAAGVEKSTRTVDAAAGTSARRGFAALRKSLPDLDEDDVQPERDVEAPTPGRIAARLLLARLFDRNPSALEQLRTASPVVIVDVPDTALFSRVAHQWKDALGLQEWRFADLACLPDDTRREQYDAVEAVFKDAPKAADRTGADMRAYAAVQLALPVMAITPSGETHLSKALLDAAAYRLIMPAIDGPLINNVIRIVTGKRCTTPIPEHVVAQVGLHELLLAVRFDRTPEQCVEMLLQLASTKTAKRGSRDLTLDELHGLDEAVAWARSTILDLDAWRRGEIGWDEIDAGVVLDGPPGTGKTTFAKVAADAMGLPLITATLAKWQSSGEAHLGHLLRAMRKDFEEARSKAAPAAIMFIDELDSFPNRSTLTHSHKDYVIEVVNAFIEQLDGLQGGQDGNTAKGRQKVIFIGATNDVRRCDPALVRAGRLNRIIHVRLPGPPDIEKMMRVRLRGDLADEPLEEMSLLAIGSSGADVERIVKDARRQARREQRALSVVDVRRAILGRTNELSAEELERAAFHEAGHIILEVLHGGPADIHAVVAGSRNAAGFVVSKGRKPTAGTLEEYRREMQGLLAGRAAEEIELGAAGDGSGGSEGSSDLSQATRIAAALVGSFGHAGPHPLLFLADRSRTHEIVDHAYLRAAVHQELTAAFDEAKRLLGEHRAALREVAARLRVRGRIDGYEVERIIADASP